MREDALVGSADALVLSAEAYVAELLYFKSLNQAKSESRKGVQWTVLRIARCVQL